MPPQRRYTRKRLQPLAGASPVATAEPPALTAAGPAAVETPIGSDEPLDAPEPFEGGRPEPEPTEQAAAPAEEGPHPAAGTEGLEPEFNRRLSALISASGGRVQILQGYRSYEGQVAAYNEAVARYGPTEAPKWAAIPGKSNHGKGVAADLRGDLNLAHQLAPQFGLFFPMGHEPWHIEAAGVRTHPSTPQEAYTDPATKHKATITEMTASGPAPVERMALLADAILSDAVAPVNMDFDPARHLGKEVTVSTPAGAPVPFEGGREPPPPAPAAQPAQEGAAEQVGQGGDVEQWISEALRISGKPESWRDPIRRAIMRESNGNPLAQNNWDSNAKAGHPSKGLTQFIDSTWQAQHWPGYDDIWNPVHSILAMIRRTDLTYGGDIERVARAGY